MIAKRTIKQRRLRQLHPPTKRWIVTQATPVSTLPDICFETTPQDLARQILGGLQPDEIIGWFDTYSEANQVALQELYAAGATP